MNRAQEWSIKNNIIQTIVDCGGTIFGGAVRDVYIHDTHAGLFYEKRQKQYQNQSQTKLEYGNPEHLPEHAGRLVVPKDIDCSIHAHNLDLLKTQLCARHHVEIQTAYERDAFRYIPRLNILPDSVVHQNWRIDPLPTNLIDSALTNSIPAELADNECIKKLINTFLHNLTIQKRYFSCITMDVMVIQVPICSQVKQPEAPFDNIDFECNGLLMNSSGIHLSKCVQPQLKNPMDRHLLLTYILNDIVNMTTRNCQSVPNEYRLFKMLQKGWTVCSKHIIVVNTIKTTVLDPDHENKEHNCLICLEKVGSLHAKLACCNARYHPKCIATYYTEGNHCIYRKLECPMCRNHMNDNDVREDAIFAKVLSNAAANVV
jgi:hypothetical protein